MLTHLVRARPYLEPVVAAAFFVLWLIAEAGRHPWLPGMRSSSAAWLAALTVMAVAIGISRLLPTISMLLACGLVAVQFAVPVMRFAGTDWPIYFGLLFVVFGVSAHIRERFRIGALAASGVLAVGVAALLVLTWTVTPYWPTDQVFHPSAGGAVTNVVAVFASCLALAFGVWFLGSIARAWFVQMQSDLQLLEKTEEELRAAELDLLVSRERDRIAQDVHDIMAHSLSVIIAQADGARFIAPSRPEAVGDSLERIASSARTSLIEVRMLIESLVADPMGHSNPTLDDLDDLIERMRGAGLDVAFETFGDASALTPTQQLAVYRIVQEGLTNALTHAGSRATARIALDWRGPGLALTIASSGDPVGRDGTVDTDSSDPDDASRPRTLRGRGLYGMRERARLAGGWLSAGPDDAETGGFVVTAYLPTVDSATGDADRVLSASTGAVPA